MYLLEITFISREVGLEDLEEDSIKDTSLKKIICWLYNLFDSKPCVFQITGAAKPNKKTFFFNCAIHAREWITAATCMYVINQVCWLRLCILTLADNSNNNN